MIRWATIVAKTPEWVELKLIQSGRCSGCSGQCNRPLFKLFSFQNDRFKLFSEDKQFQIVNRKLLFDDSSRSRQVGQKIGLEINTDLMLSSAFQFYIVPLVLIILGMVAGYLLALTLSLPTDLLTFIGFSLGLAVVFFRQRLAQQSTAYSTLPKVTIL